MFSYENFRGSLAMENEGLNHYIRANTCDTILYDYPILQDYHIVGMLIAQEKWISAFGMLSIQHTKAEEKILTVCSCP